MLPVIFIAIIWILVGVYVAGVAKNAEENAGYEDSFFGGAFVLFVVVWPILLTIMRRDKDLFPKGCINFKRWKLW